jgi:hypothetical protein|tara:strand:- start:209 stop:967 length:759 start_codon:yes stop_codon:yes gene_type:complete
MSKKLIITEQEKNEIKSLYNINEQGAGDILKALADSILKMLDKTDSEEDDESFLNDTNSGSVDSKWDKITKKVIDEFEGGYWNPKCGHTTKGMGVSTETMFGLDRKNGNIESTPEGKEFFRIIDKEKTDLGMQQFCKTWKHYYRGGNLEDKLKTLAAKIMKYQYDNNSKNYFSSELRKRVESNDRLLMHFSYASWNGPGYFQKFAKSLESGIKSGKSDEELVKQAISDRKNTNLYHQDKVASVMTSTNLNLA